MKKSCAKKRLLAFVWVICVPFSLGAIPWHAPLYGQENDKGLVLHYTFDKLAEDKVANQANDLHSGVSNNATFAEEKKSGRSLKVRKDHEKSGFVETPDHAELNSMLMSKN